VQDADQNENVPTETHRGHQVAHLSYETTYAARVFGLDPNLSRHVRVPKADA